jgi:hypothetical protein
MQAVEEGMREFYVKKGALFEYESPADEFGVQYTDGYALFGMALEEYAHFLVAYHDETRMDEAQEFIDEVLKVL